MRDSSLVPNSRNTQACSWYCFFLLQMIHQNIHFRWGHNYWCPKVRPQSARIITVFIIIILTINILIIILNIIIMASSSSSYSSTTGEHVRNGTQTFIWQISLKVVLRTKRFRWMLMANDCQFGRYQIIREYSIYKAINFQHGLASILIPDI